MSSLFNPPTSHSANSSTNSLDDLDDSTKFPNRKHSIHDLSPNSRSDNWSTYSTASGSSSYMNSPFMKNDIQNITFSFAAAGWLQVYLFGCAHALIENVPGVRIEGLDDTYMEYVAKKMKKEAAKQEEENNTHHNAFSNTSPGAESGISPILPTPRKLDQTQELPSRGITPTALEQSNSEPIKKADDENQKQQQQQPKKQDLTPPPPVFKFCGSSAGSLASAAILLGTDMTEMLEYAVGCVNYARSHWTHAFELRKFVVDGVSKFAIDIFKKNHKEKMDVHFTPQSTPPVSPRNNNGDDDDDCPPPPNVPDSPSSTSSATSSAATSPTQTPLANKNHLNPADDKKGDIADTSVSFFTLIEDNEKHQNAKDFPGDAGGWLGTEFYFPRHIRDQLRERLGVYATSLPYIKEVCFTEFESTVDLEEALVASCLLAPLAGMPFRLRRTGEWVCDGGLRSFQPRKGLPGVVTISAMYFNAADIAPSVFVPAWWGLYPPPEEQYRQLFKLGYNDMLVWLWKNYVVEKPETSEARREKLMKYEESKMPQKHGFFGYILDFFALIFFLGLLRPFAFIAIYAELWFVSTIAFFATIFHELFPHTFDFLIGTKSLRNKKQGGTRLDSFKDLWAVFRNIVSLRTMAHLTFGYRNVNSKRLGKYSRLYRVLRPFVTGASNEEEERKSNKRHHHHHHHHRHQENKKTK